jgi:hypothetical protein
MPRRRNRGVVRGGRDPDSLDGLRQDRPRRERDGDRLRQARPEVVRAPRFAGLASEGVRGGLRQLRRVVLPSGGGMVSPNDIKDRPAQADKRALGESPTPTTPRLTGRGVPRLRSVAARRPDLVAQLDPSPNGDLDPNQVAPMSRRSVWWRCPACGHEWRTLLSIRARGHGCPECRGHVVDREPKAGPARPFTRGPPSRTGRRAAPDPQRRPRRLHACALVRAVGLVAVRHLRARVASNPQNRAGCPRVQRAAPVPRERSLAVLRPYLAAELHPRRNGVLDP